MSKEQKIELRHLNIEDYEELHQTMEVVYANIEDPPWSKKQFEALLNKFPEGQLCITVNNELVAAALAIVVDYQKFGDKHTFKKVTGNHTFTTHTLKGDVLYGIEMFVHPDFRDLRLGRRLYDARKEICEQFNLRAIVAGGRIPNYHKYSDELTPKQYIEKVQQRELYDPVLTFQLSNGFRVKKILRNYLELDERSESYATLLEWNNIYYEEDEKSLSTRKAVVRLGLVQWQMRHFEDLQDLVNQIEFFVDSVSGYKADFIMFPEFFTTPLMKDYNHLPEEEAIRKLAGYTTAILDKLREFAVSYNVNIVAGSMPFLEDGHLYNNSYLCRRDGSSEEYRKIHITPNELSTWGMMGGDVIQTFDTDAGKIGIQICYDVEFPEVSRIMANQGLDILFVPFLTDTQNGYNRVRYCSQARAIENECYVAIAGAVGNLPSVNNMDIQYAQSAVFSPSDFAFPTTAIISEATPNTEMMLLADVDLDLLKELHHQGSVQNLKDRRNDLYLKNLSK